MKLYFSWGICLILCLVIWSLTYLMWSLDFTFLNQASQKTWFWRRAHCGSGSGKTFLFYYVIYCFRLLFALFLSIPYRESCFAQSAADLQILSCLHSLLVSPIKLGGRSHHQVRVQRTIYVFHFLYLSFDVQPKLSDEADSRKLSLGSRM